MNLTKRLIAQFAVISLLAIALSFLGFTLIAQIHHKKDVQKSLFLQTSAVAKSVEIVNDRLRGALVKVANSESHSAIGQPIYFFDSPLTRDFGDSDFFAVGALKYKITNKSWVYSWVSTKKSGSELKTYLPITALANEITSETKGENKSLYYLPVQLQGDDSKYLAVYTKYSNSLYFGLLPITYLAHFASEYKGSVQNLFILGQNKYLLSHQSLGKLGEDFSASSLSQALANEHKISSSVEYDDTLGNEQVGAYELVENSNLIIAISQPLKGLLSFIDGPVLLMIFILSVVFILSGLSIWKSMRPIEESIAYILNSMRALASGKQLFPPEMKNSITLLSVKVLENLESKLLEPKQSPSEEVNITKKMRVENEEKILQTNQAATQKACANFIEVLSSPTSAIIGHLHMAKARPDNEVLSESLKKAESEARLIKEFVEDLKVLVVQSDNTKAPVLINDLVNDIIKDKLTTFNQKGVRIHKRLYSKKYTNGCSLDTAKAISYILDFFVENFSSQLQRDLMFSLEDNGFDLILRIETNSEQLNREVVYENLHLQSPQGVIEGSPLKLPVARALIESGGGRIEASAGTHFQVALSLTWPILSQNAVDDYFKNQEVQEVKLDEVSKDEVDAVVNMDVVEGLEENIIDDHNTGNAVAKRSEIFDESELAEIKLKVKELEANGEVESVLQAQEDEEVDHFVMQGPSVQDQEPQVSSHSLDEDIEIVHSTKSSTLGSVDMPEPPKKVLRSHEADLVEEFDEDLDVTITDVDDVDDINESIAVTSRTSINFPVEIRRPKVRVDN